MVHRQLEPQRLPQAGLTEVLRLILGRRKLARVHGSSMTPTLEDGDWVLYHTRQDAADPTGQIVVCTHPYEKRLLIKRVRAVLPSGDLFIEGDNPQQSTDSRVFGPIAPSQVIGHAVSCRSIRQR